MSTKSENENTISKYRCFIESKFVGFKRLFVLIYPTKMIVLKGLMSKSVIWQKVLLRIITSLSVEKSLMTKQLILI